jgi:hypothetical protein
MLRTAGQALLVLGAITVITALLAATVPALAVPRGAVPAMAVVGVFAVLGGIFLAARRP